MVLWRCWALRVWRFVIWAKTILRLQKPNTKVRTMFVHLIKQFNFATGSDDAVEFSKANPRGSFKRMKEMLI
jgi:hypothetical protein